MSLSYSKPKAPELWEVSYKKYGTIQRKEFPTKIIALKFIVQQLKNGYFTNRDSFTNPKRIN